MGRWVGLGWVGVGPGPTKKWRMDCWQSPSPQTAFHGPKLLLSGWVGKGAAWHNTRRGAGGWKFIWACHWLASNTAQLLRCHGMLKCDYRLKCVLGCHHTPDSNVRGARHLEKITSVLKIPRQNLVHFCCAKFRLFLIPPPHRYAARYVCVQPGDCSPLLGRNSKAGPNGSRQPPLCATDFNLSQGGREQGGSHITFSTSIVGSGQGLQSTTQVLVWFGGSQGLARGGNQGLSQQGSGLPWGRGGRFFEVRSMIRPPQRYC